MPPDHLPVYSEAVGNLQATRDGLLEKYHQARGTAERRAVIEVGN